MNDKITYMNSGRFAIRSFLTDCETVIVPANFCVDVLNGVLSDKTTILAPMSDPFDHPKYEVAINSVTSAKTGLVFVHPYGVVDCVKRDEIFELCASKNIYFIDDFCLSTPQNFFQYSLGTEYNKYAAIISFGYSKYVDLGTGCLTKSNNGCFSQHIKNIEELKYINNNLSSFLTTIKLEEKRRDEHSKKIRELYLKHFSMYHHVDSPWRFCIKLHKSSKLLKFFRENTNDGLFWGFNYPPLTWSKNTKTFEASWKDETYNVVNLFHDFRFNLKNAKRLVRMATCA